MTSVRLYFLIPALAISSSITSFVFILGVLLIGTDREVIWTHTGSVMAKVSNDFPLSHQLCAQHHWNEPVSIICDATYAYCLGFLTGFQLPTPFEGPTCGHRRRERVRYLCRHQKFPNLCQDFSGMVLEEIGVAVPSFIAQHFMERRPLELCEVSFSFSKPDGRQGYPTTHHSRCPFCVKEMSLCPSLSLISGSLSNPFTFVTCCSIGARMPPTSTSPCLG